jgi:hypothetical protein
MLRTFGGQDETEPVFLLLSLFLSYWNGDKRIWAASLGTIRGPAGAAVIGACARRRRRLLRLPGEWSHSGHCPLFKPRDAACCRSPCNRTTLLAHKPMSRHGRLTPRYGRLFCGQREGLRGFCPGHHLVPLAACARRTLHLLTGGLGETWVAVLEGPQE